MNTPLISLLDSVLTYMRTPSGLQHYETRMAEGLAITPDTMKSEPVTAVTADVALDPKDYELFPGTYRELENLL